MPWLLWLELDEPGGKAAEVATLSRTEPAWALSCMREEVKNPSLAVEGEVRASKTPEPVLAPDCESCALLKVV